MSVLDRTGDGSRPGAGQIPGPANVHRTHHALLNTHYSAPLQLLYRVICLASSSLPGGSFLLEPHVRSWQKDQGRPSTFPGQPASSPLLINGCDKVFRNVNIATKPITVAYISTNIPPEALPYTLHGAGLINPYLPQPIITFTASKQPSWQPSRSGRQPYRQFYQPLNSRHERSVISWSLSLSLNKPVNLPGIRFVVEHHQQTLITSKSKPKISPHSFSFYNTDTAQAKTRHPIVASSD